MQFQVFPRERDLGTCTKRNGEGNRESMLREGNTKFCGGGLAWRGLDEGVIGMN